MLGLGQYVEQFFDSLVDIHAKIGTPLIKHFDASRFADDFEREFHEREPTFFADAKLTSSKESLCIKVIFFCSCHP